MQVMFEGILLKPSMVTPGADSSKREKPEVVADYTLKLLRRRVPPAVPGEPPLNYLAGLLACMHGTSSVPPCFAQASCGVALALLLQLPADRSNLYILSYERHVVRLFLHGRDWAVAACLAHGARRRRLTC